jgi:hypothetical protein
MALLFLSSVLGQVTLLSCNVKSYTKRKVQFGSQNEDEGNQKE